MAKATVFYLYFFSFFLTLSSPTLAEENGASESPALTEVKQMFEQDQKMIQTGHVDHLISLKRRQRVLELVAQSQLKSAEGLFYAAIMLQHTPKQPTPDNFYKSTSPENHLLAFYLSKRAFEMGFEVAGWYAGAAMDRYLLAQGKQQRYGTHWRLNSSGDKYVLDPVEPGFTDTERAMLGIEPLADILKIVDEENEKLKKGKSD